MLPPKVDYLRLVLQDSKKEYSFAINISAHFKCYHICAMIPVDFYLPGGFSPGFANCQTYGFLLLLDFARKCNFVESVYCCKNLKTPSINSLQKIKADYLMKRQEIYSFLFFLQGPTLRCATVLQMAGVY